MRIASSVVIALAASISASGCSPFQSDRSQVDGSFRQAPTSELMAMAERYEQRGDYAHAARLYEELLKGDPNRAQVRERLHALASYGVVSPHAQEALVDSVEHIVADHQRQREETQAQDNVEQFLADMPSSSPGYTLVDAAAGVDQWEIPQPQPATQTTITRAEQSAPAVTAPAATPTTRSEVPQGPQAWHSTVIRPQESPLEHTEEPAAENRPLTQVVSTGSNLWRAATIPTTVEAGTADALPTETTNNFAEWAQEEACNELATTAPTEDSSWTPRSEFVSVEPDAVDVNDAFCDPIVSGAQDTAVEIPAVEAASTTPLQQAQAAFTLWQLSGDATQCVPMLISLLESEDSQVVEVSCYLIGEIGPSAEMAKASLQTVLNQSEHEGLSILAAEALAKIEPASEESVKRLVEASRSTDHQTRLLAAITLASVDHAHQGEVVPALARMLDDESAEVRSAAALSLGGWGEAALPHTRKLEELALSDTTEVSEAARISLECLGL
jgi:hypothetical protein